MSQSVYKWIKSGLIKSDDQQQALVVAGERANPAAWQLFISRMLVLLGFLSLACGVVYFFAYNWNDMSRFYKFTSIQVLLVATFLVYYFRAANQWVQQTCLLTAAIVLGALLALFGQTYQTGADPWQLFATWAWLIFPLVLFSRAEVLWVFLAVLINTALLLKFDTERSLLGWSLNGEQVTWVLLLFNALLVVATEFATQAQAGWVRVVALNDRWAAQILGLGLLLLITITGLQGIWGNGATRGFSMLLFLGFMGLAFGFYRWVRKDLLLLTGWALAVIVFVLALLANTVFDNFDAGGLLLMAISLILMSTFAVSWIKKTHQLFKQEVSS